MRSIMSQQKLSKRIERKFLSFFRSLCTPSPADSLELQQSGNPPNSKPLGKRRRVTFILEQVLIKLTRKNIILQQFQNFAYGVALPPSLEKHIATRMKDIAVAVFQGHFSDRAMKTVAYPVKLIPKPLCFLSTGNFILARGWDVMRAGTVDAYVGEIKQKSSRSIEEVLISHYQQLSSFVFVCHEEVTAAQVGEVFRMFRDRFIFELERVMILDKCISTIVYVSNDPHFLNIEKDSLLEFYLADIVKKHPHLERTEFAIILDLLLEANFYIQVAATLGELMKGEVICFREKFLRTITQKFPYVVPSLKGMEIQRQRSQYQATLLEKSIYSPTPLFRVRDSTNNGSEHEQSYAPPELRSSMGGKKECMSFE